MAERLLAWKYYFNQVILNFPIKAGLFSTSRCIKTTRFLCSGNSTTTTREVQQKPEKDYSCVNDEVAKLLESSKPTFLNGRYVKAKLSARRLAEKRKQCIAADYYWPVKPLRDRCLDVVSKGTKRDKQREVRQKLIEENMKKMPEMIAEYRAKMKELRLKRRELKEKQKEKQFVAQRLGYHPKDPRGLQKLLQEETLEAKKKKRMQKKTQNVT